jgi:hypothetical protein
MEADQNEGKPVNVQQLTLAYEELGRLIEGTDADRPTQDIDMSRLSDDEVRTMERILAKAHGEDIGESEEVFKVEFDPAAENYETAYLKSRIAELEGQLAAQSGLPAPSAAPTPSLPTTQTPLPNKLLTSTVS